jgi:Ca-activated chloride channel family protein
MKTLRPLPALLLVASALFLVVQGCHQGGLPVGAQAEAPGKRAPQEVWFFGRVVDTSANAAENVGQPTAGRQRTEMRGFEVPLHADSVPGCGAIVAQDPAGSGTVPLPLEHTDVKAQVRGSFATVELEQRFKNPFDTKIEAVYVFPLPADAAVHDFLMTIGDRTIRGIVRERAEAERMYAEARAQGYVASLLTEERPNVFTQKVANIEPGKSLAVSIRYFNALPLVDGWYEFAFPMVVGPRFNPPGSTAGIGAAARTTPGASGQPTEVPYLAPGERSGHDVALALDLDAGTRIEAWECKSHRIDARKDGEKGLKVTLAQDDRIPNRDFVLRWRTAGADLRPALVTGRDDGGEYFALTLHPPADLDDLEREPIDLWFVLDTSGSMKGRPIELSRRAMHKGLDRLRPQDTFQILRFSESVSGLAPHSLAVNPANVRKGHDFIDDLEADGGTMMMHGLRASLSGPRDPERRRIVAFLTDGYIGNETEILTEEKRLLGDARVFSFGIGTSVNRYLLDAMAFEGHGVSAFVGVSDEAERIMVDFLERLARPALEEVALEFDGLTPSDVYPERIPDVLHGRPVTIVGRMQRAASDGGYSINVVGKIGGRAVRRPIQLASSAQDAVSLPWIWARARIAALSSRGLGADASHSAEMAAAIRATALEYGLSSAYTAFIAVDSSQRTAGDHGVTVPVAVPVPEGVRYSTTVESAGAGSSTDK